MFISNMDNNIERLRYVRTRDVPIVSDANPSKCELCDEANACADSLITMLYIGFYVINVQCPLSFDLSFNINFFFFLI